MRSKREAPSTSVPGRVELLGNHTDYNEGVVLAAAVDRAVIVRGAARSDGRISLSSPPYPPFESQLSQLQPQAGELRWANYPLGITRELLASGLPIRGFSLNIESDLPADCGLGSSGALSVATAFFLLRLHQCDLSPLEVAKICRRAEQRFAGVQSGLLDQVTSIFGKANNLVFFDCRTEEVRTVPFPNHLAVIVADSGTKRELAAGDYNERREETRAAAARLGVRTLRDVSKAHLDAHMDLLPVLHRRAAHVVEENDRVQLGCELLQRGDAAGFGELMNASHESSRENFENSTPELDRLVDLARKQPGVLGARLTGGGFGGAIVALCQAEAAEPVARQLASISPKTFVCRPADGALLRNSNS